MLPLIWRLWCLALLMQGRTASSAFLPFSAEGIFRAFGNLIMEQNQEAMANERFDSTVDISKLPPNYHNEEQKQRKMGNATVYSHREISKVTDNRTGEMIFSEKTVTSIEQGDTLLEKKKEVCVNDNDCQKGQFCSRSLLASQCQECKAKLMTCQKDEECCLGYLCVWGKCAEGVSRGDSGTRCDPNREACSPGLCCTATSSLSFPVCAPYPKEGEACQAPSTTFFGLMGWGSQAAFAKSGKYCPCAQGLQCRSKRHAISTCEKLEDSADVSSLGKQLPVFQPLLTNRDKEEAFYDDSRQDGPLAIVSLPRGPYYMEDAGLSEDYEEKRLLPWEGDRDDPNRSDFQELEHLADQMGQYFGPGFY
uniref:dickkopf-like protein 1 n=1 Tax=Euleptes europaea TaxID=460621 RepID=UPI00253F66D9|nr:dickkopf-like protein 1 [Euleptes europaea]